MLKLVFPNITHKNAYEKMIKEWWKIEKIPNSPTRLFVWKDFEEFLQIITKDITDCEWWVNATLFFLIEDWNDDIIWALHLRHSINNPKLSSFWWHIWYWIAPKYRKKWYCTKMLELWLQEAKKLWIEKLLICCDETNLWSMKVIINNWWIFESKIKHDWIISDRYWIEI